MSIDVLAEGLGFPEGPIAMPDGSVILTEIARGTLTRVWNGKTEVVCDVGGGPNGAAIGPDGAIYVANNGGGGLGPSHPGRPRIQAGIDRVDLATGKSERLYEKVGDNLLTAPNDIVFDRQGGAWFTDFGHTQSRMRNLSGIYYMRPDGSHVEEISFGGTGYNGIGLSPDEKTVYAAESYTGRLIAFDLEAPGKLAVDPDRPILGAGRMVGVPPGRAFFDSLAVQADGQVCIAAISGGVITMALDGTCRATAIPDRLVTNICFGGADMREAYITGSAAGKLFRTRWPDAGLKLNFSG